MAMTEMDTRLRRTEIEARIDQCRDTAAGNIIEIGRWLNVAKDECVVPHGEWEAWVQAHASMSLRSAQRVMQIARELPEGSPLASLGVAKLSSLLALPPAERERAAKEMGADQMSSREVDECVKAIRKERDEALRVVGAQKKRIAQMQGEHEEAIRNATEAARKQERARVRDELDSLTDEAARLRAQSGNSGRVAALEQALRDKESEIDMLSDRLDEAQIALARSGMQAGETVSPVNRILGAIGALMTEAGQAPGEIERMQGGIDSDTQQILIGQAQTVGRWAMQIIAACGGKVL